MAASTLVSSPKNQSISVELMDMITLTTEQTQELTALVEDLNERLRSAASSSAERAFGIGCSLGLMLVVIVALVLYSLHIMNLILAVLVGIMTVLFLVGAASLLSSIARSNTLKRTYQREVEPEINQFTARYGLPRQQFDTLASQILSDGAPLQIFLEPLPPEQGEEATVNKKQVKQ
jgi:hypothetical protein